MFAAYTCLFSKSLSTYSEYGSQVHKFDQILKTLHWLPVHKHERFYETPSKQTKKLFTFSSCLHFRSNYILQHITKKTKNKRNILVVVHTRRKTSGNQAFRYHTVYNLACKRYALLNRWTEELNMVVYLGCGTKEKGFRSLLKIKEKKKTTTKNK